MNLGQVGPWHHMFFRLRKCHLVLRAHISNQFCRRGRVTVSEHINGRLMPALCYRGDEASTHGVKSSLFASYLERENHTSWGYLWMDLRWSQVRGSPPLLYRKSRRTPFKERGIGKVFEEEIVPPCSCFLKMRRLHAKYIRLQERYKILWWSCQTRCWVFRYLHWIRDHWAPW